MPCWLPDVLPLLWMAWLGVRYRTKVVRSADDPEEVLLFTEIVQDDPAAGAQPDAEPVTA